MVTAYDFTMARLSTRPGSTSSSWATRSGWSSRALANTLPVTLDEIAYHSRAVARAAARAHVVGDMPFMSYQVSPTQAVESAGKLVKDGACESVKLEGGEDFAEHVWRIVRAGVPVMGHVGLMPQSVHALGGFKVQGRGDEAAAQRPGRREGARGGGRLRHRARGHPARRRGRRSRRRSGVPTIGIGAGPRCDGQVLVCTDLLGMGRGHAPKFAKRYAELGDAIVAATRRYVDEVQGGVFPAEEHSYKPNRAPESGPRMTEEREPARVVSIRH